MLHFTFLSGNVGKLACGDVHKYPLNPKFKRITPPFPLRNLPSDVIHDLSTDQHYGYRICSMIISGVVDEDLLTLQVGIINHARWLTTAGRFCRVYVSKHGLVGEDEKNLQAIVKFIISHYFPMWFEIKCQPRLTSGPHHILKEVAIIRSMKGKDEHSKKVKSIAMHFIDKGAWQAHSEPLLLSLLSSTDVEDRRFGISKILQIRDGKELGCNSPRQVFTPTLNWEAKSLRNLQDWNNATEPNVTSSIPSVNLWKFLEEPLSLPNITCHAQSCERCVKEVTIASAAVFGEERRDGYIRARTASRALVPINESKQDLAALLPSYRSS